MNSFNERLIGNQDNSALSVTQLRKKKGYKREPSKQGIWHDIAKVSKAKPLRQTCIDSINWSTQID